MHTLCPWLPAGCNLANRLNVSEDLSWSPWPSCGLPSRLLPTCYGPPVVILVARLDDKATGCDNVLLQFASPIQVVESVDRRRRTRRPLGERIWLRCLFHVTVIPRTLSPDHSLLLAVLEDPRHHHVLVIAFVPTSSALPLLQGPHIDECFGAGVSGPASPGMTALQSSQNCLYRGHSPFLCGEMVDDRDGYDKVESKVRVRKTEEVGHNGLVSTATCNPCERRRPGTRHVTESNTSLPPSSALPCRFFSKARRGRRWGDKEKEEEEKKGRKQLSANKVSVQEQRTRGGGASLPV